MEFSLSSPIVASVFCRIKVIPYVFPCCVVRQSVLASSSPNRLDGPESMLPELTIVRLELAESLGLVVHFVRLEIDGRRALQQSCDLDMVSSPLDVVIGIRKGNGLDVREHGLLCSGSSRSLRLVQQMPRQLRSGHAVSQYKEFCIIARCH